MLSTLKRLIFEMLEKLFNYLTIRYDRIGSTFSACFAIEILSLSILFTNLVAKQTVIIVMAGVKIYSLSDF